jgi:UDP-N-acetylglucosamine:LPS N-acetylglucosamine transferase
MGKVKEWLIQQQENGMSDDEIDAMWHQKQLEEQEQEENLSDKHLLDIAKTRNMFEWQAIQDAIYYSKRIRTVRDK